MMFGTFYEDHCVPYLKQWLYSQLTILFFQDGSKKFTKQRGIYLAVDWHPFWAFLMKICGFRSLNVLLPPFLTVYGACNCCLALTGFISRVSNGSGRGKEGRLDDEDEREQETKRQIRILPG